MVALQVPVHIAQRDDRAGLCPAVGAFITMVEDNLKRVVQRAHVSVNGPPSSLRARPPLLCHIPLLRTLCMSHVTHKLV